MAAMIVVVLLAIVSTCQGAPRGTLQEARMEKGDQRLYKSFGLLGLFMGLKYKDADEQPKIGRNFQLEIDDLKKYVKQARCNKVVLDVDFDGGVAPGDGLFRLDIYYTLVHSDGVDEEKGMLMVKREYDGELWTTTLQSIAWAFPGQKIMPAAFNNMEVKLESDRSTKFHAKYVNPTMNRFIHVNIDRVPGKSVHVLITNDLRKDEFTFKVGDLNFKNMDGDFNIAIDGTLNGAIHDKTLGEAVLGKISGSKNGDVNVVQIEMEKGNKKFLQIDTKIKNSLAAMSFEARTKYAILGGKIAGKVLMKFSNNVLTLKNTDEESNSIELIVKVALGESLYIEGKKNGESMWKYDTKRTIKRTGDVLELSINTEMTLSEKSKVSKFLTEIYPYGAFKTRSNMVHIFIDKKNRNKLAPKFKVDVHLQKDGANVVELIADTAVSPYVFKLAAPSFFTRLGIQQSSIDMTADHQIGKSLVIHANILGGIHLEAKRGDNANNVSLLIMIGGVQMFKFTLSTEKVNNANEFKFILRDRLELNSDTDLYLNTISRWMDPPYSTRSGEFEFYVNKADKNVLLNKFSVKGKVMKDDRATELKLLMTTNEQPYKFELFSTGIVRYLKPGFHELKISVAHNPGQSLEMKSSFNGFMRKSNKNEFKIYKTGSGNERKVEVDGKELVKGDYTLSDNSFSTKLTAGADYLEPKITWEGKLPQNKAEVGAFLLKNNIVVKVSGSKRNLDLSLNWKMTKPDFNFGTPENGKISLNAKGNNPRWGDYSLSRDANWKVENKAIEVNWTGLAQFAQGRLATATPIETAFNFKILLDKADLIGKFMKKVNGKEYSIDFPEGSGVMPKIVMGQ